MGEEQENGLKSLRLSDVVEQMMITYAKMNKPHRHYEGRLASMIRADERERRENELRYNAFKQELDRREKIYLEK